MKSYSLLRNRTSKGFGLLEVILVFAIVIGAAAVVFTVFQSAKPSADASNEGSNISTIATNLKSTYGIGNSYANLDNPSAIKAKVVPASMTDGTNVTSGWGAVTISHAACAVGADPRCFSIEYDNVPQDACLKLVQGIAGFFDDVSVDAATTVFTNGKLDPALAVGACGAGSSYAGKVTFIGH